MRFTPIGDRLLIKPDEAEKETKFGLIIPETVAERVYRGVVVAADPKRYNTGVHVVYSKYGGTEIKLDGETYIVVAERDVLGVIEDE